MGHVSKCTHIKFIVMSKQKYLEAKLEAFADNIQAHATELGQTHESLFAHVGISYLDKQEAYQSKDFTSFERIVKQIYQQRGMRAISSSHRVLHELYTKR